METVLVSQRELKSAHRDLYHSPEGAYRIIEGDILTAVASLPGELTRLHIVATWGDILRLAAWKKDLGIGDIFVLLKTIGVRQEDLLPFRNCDISDIFPWLYYGKHLTVLRKLCRIAKTNAERHLRNRDARVYCHLISEDRHGIIASSL